jgi:hypothetical protein
VLEIFGGKRGRQGKQGTTDKATGKYIFKFQNRQQMTFIHTDDTPAGHLHSGT